MNKVKILVYDSAINFIEMQGATFVDDFELFAANSDCSSLSLSSNNEILVSARNLSPSSLNTCPRKRGTNTKSIAVRNNPAVNIQNNSYPNLLICQLIR